MCRKISLFRKRLLSILVLAIVTLPVIAQDGGLKIEIGVDKKEWYEEPWAWVVGAGVFILLLVAILRSGKKR